MHPLQSVVTFADVGDFVEAGLSEDLSLTIRGPFAKTLAGDDDNLVLRAARALAQAAGVPAKAKLILEKRLPIASGIGGGSSDAAATLRALSALWRLDWSHAQLAELGRGLGSDVPVFFAASASAYMTGLGEDCAPMALPEFPAVLINPMTSLATPAVYRQFDAMQLGSALRDAPTPHWQTEEEALHHISVTGNDLEAPAIALAPVVSDVLASLRAQETVRYAGLSGSGATCFALLADWSGAKALCAKLKARHKTWWIAETRLGGA
jgi:4-diphosphocytidyl-2-C-methyl-D-erythritol kinase